MPKKPPIKISVKDPQAELRAHVEEQMLRDYGPYMRKQAPAGWERMIKDRMNQVQQNQETSKAWA